MATHLMPGVYNLPHKARFTVGHPAKNKESSLYPGTTEKVQYTPRITDHPRRKVLPVLRGNTVGKCFDVKVILNVNTEAIGKIGEARVRGHKSAVAW